MSLFDEVHISPSVKMKPTMAVSNSVSIDLVGEGIYIEDGAIYIPIRLWEEIQREQSHV